MSTGSSIVTNAPTDLAAIAAKAPSRSVGSRTANSESSTLSDWAVSFMAARYGLSKGFSGLIRAPACAKSGTTSFSSSRRFASSSGPRPGEALYETSSDRVASLRDDDRNCRRRLLGGQNAGPMRDNDIGFQIGQLGGQLRKRKLVVCAFEASLLDDDVLALDVAERGKSLS